MLFKVANTSNCGTSIDILFYPDSGEHIRIDGVLVDVGIRRQTALVEAELGARDEQAVETQSVDTLPP